MNDSNDPLDPLLERWRTAAPPLPQATESEVWRRIAAAETFAPGRSSRFAILTEALARPSFAAAFVAACVLLGLFLAEVRVSRLQRERSAEFAKRYLQLIDPLLANDSTSTAPASPRS